MKILAISDCHYKYNLSNREDASNAQILLRFLKTCVGKYDLVVWVGDIFDLWWDGKYTVVKQYFPLLKIMAELHESGARLVFISGNHDFWFGDFLPDFIGCEIHPEGFTLKTDGKVMRFEHGDTHTTNDLRYQLYRKLIRMKTIRQLFALLHPDIALSLGTLLSRSSRTRKEHDALRTAKTKGLKHYAAGLIKQNKADIVIMGHSHNPALERLGSGFYANCGDWLGHYSYIEIDAGIPSLKQYSE